jgi:UDP-N-acetylglucosamine--N-acetylmuramyl-(pentapeptide) pyrophosphoryl-undecaprenol N-acetylglucosamine transferase
MAQIGEELRNDGVDVGFSSFFYAIDFLRKRGFTCDAVSAVDVEWRAGGVSTWGTVRRLPTLIANFAMQVQQERRIMRRMQPDLVLSDTRLSAVIAAKMEGIPSITIANQLRILVPPRLQWTWLRIMENIDAETLGLFWSCSRFTLVPDLPPPYTVSHKNTSRIRTLNGRIRYVGFLAPSIKPVSEKIHRVSEELGLNGDKPVVFANISGPPETKSVMMDASLRAADMLRNRFVFVVSQGEVGGDDEPRQISGGWFFGWCPVKDEMVSIADLLIVRGGHSTLAQAIECGKPVVVAPIQNHSEQYANASRIDEMGIGMMIDSSALSGQSLARAVEKVNGDLTYRKRVGDIRRIASQFNGVKKTIDIARSLL